MIDQMFQALNRYMDASKAANEQTITNQYSTTVDNKKWIYCVALAKCGWEAYSCKTISTSATDARYPSQERKTIVKWRKEGKDEITIVLSFAEQRLWIAHLLKDDMTL